MKKKASKNPQSTIPKDDNAKMLSSWQVNKKNRGIHHGKNEPYCTIVKTSRSAGLH
jgi:hypothetical protein